MTLRFKYIVGLAAVAAGLVSCVKEDFENAANGSYDGIQFNISTVDTKTVYGAQASDNSWPLYWVAGDPIRIYCAEAEDAKQADYTVTPSSTNSNTGSMALASGSTALQWGGDSNDHNFYAVYPNTATIENGIATFQINRNQKATVTTTNGYDNNVVAAPDMRNAYMVAKTTTKPTDEAVGLTFKPIMTTLDVVIKAADGDLNSTSAARITGISVVSTMNTASTAQASEFQYDINNQQITGSAGSGSITKLSETTFVGLVDSNGNATYVDLASSKTLTITVFMPPMSIEAAKNLGRQVKIRVHATGNTELVASLKTNDAESENWTTQLKPSTKRTIKLPALPSSNDVIGNNWITPLDDNIYVSQLSIPGTHDAATGDGTTFSMGKTQDIDIEGQWEMGIRAFDIRPREGSNDDSQLDYGNNLWINHGGVSTTWSMDAIVKTFKTYLEANPGEFAIVIMRHETEGDGTSESWPDTMADALNDYAALTNTTTGKGLTVNFKPDLTIGECRGKILFMMRSWTPYTGGPTVGGYHGWSHDAAAVKTEIWGPGSTKGTLYVQDYYNIDLGFTIIPNYDKTSHENIFKKQNALCDMLELSAKSHTDDTFKNTWFINHTSGYLYYTIGDAGVSTTAGYRYNARNNHPVVYNFITNNTVTINGTTRTRPTGSTGIILMDFVGAATSDGVAVQGDLCPQAIIDNNYKYRMKRKGE
ncbi:MAG: fimbrillin family protein [Bacteroidales bacterium]|nr:fimbrillin family protein [Bacteroidales bacterium]